MHGSVLHVYNFRALPHAGIRIGRDSLIEPGCSLQGRTRLGERVHLKPHCVIEDSEIGDDSELGPSAHLRPGNRVRLEGDGALRFLVRLIRSN